MSSSSNYRQHVNATAYAHVGMLSSFLRRSRKGAELTNKAMAERIHEQYPDRAESSLRGDISGLEGFRTEVILDAVFGNRPYGRIFDLYLKELGLDCEGTGRVQELIGNIRANREEFLTD